MSMPNRYLNSTLLVAGFLTLATLLANSAYAEDATGKLGFHLKQTLGSTPVDHVDSIVSPDGASLPDGSGTAAAGKPLYLEKCASCHGNSGKTPGNAIAGGKGTISTEQPFKTVGSYWPYATTLYDYIARAMPYDKQKSLTSDEVYAITAYVLQLNHIVKNHDVIDRVTLPKIVMPNADGFTELQ